ncbi:OmpA family protein [Parasediminibacterium paludis]|uniref:OmpA family protein n=1 Tax=Parasediminibacterium paludis TaxID=908966 RepID=A0ABV8PXF6_9BACT
MKPFFLILAIALSYTSFSQTYNPDKVNKKALLVYQKAMEHLGYGEYKEAIPDLEKCIAIDKNYVDAYLSLAGAYGELKNYKAAIANYELAREKDSMYFKLYNLPYSINLAGEGRFEEALAAINAFATTPNLGERSLKSLKYRKDCYTFAINYQQKHPPNNYIFNPINLGDSINTERSEYFPSLTVNDSLLVFTRREGGGEYFYKANITNPEVLPKAVKIAGDINDEPFKGAISVSADGEWMIFAGNIGNNSHDNFDLYICYATPTGWSEPQNLDSNINTGYWESAPSLSPDKRALYFSSNRPGGYGGADLYVSYRDEKGNWSKAINMGPDVNTLGDETAPYIHADNQTLYFTSSGLPGYGGTDIFIMRKGLGGAWSIPENLGYPINTIENEGSLAVAPNGVSAYYASDRSDSRGGLDLYKFDLRADVQPYKTLYVKGFVYDKSSSKGLPSNVELIDNNTGKTLMNVQTDETGFYFVTLPVKKDYTFAVNRKGYLYFSKLYELSSKIADSIYKEDIYLQPIELNKITTLNNIQFENNSYQLKAVSKIELDKLLQLLTDNPTIKIEVDGHTDNVGKAEDNLKLSTNRAKTVVDYLIEKGIAPQRLQYKGFGATKPLADNATEAGRSTNRRTEFTVVGM